MTNEIMMFDPQTGKRENVYPSQDQQYREWHGLTAWLYNPWTGKNRDTRDIGSDVQGLLIRVTESVDRIVTHDNPEPVVASDPALSDWSKIKNTNDFDALVNDTRNQLKSIGLPAWSLDTGAMYSKWQAYLREQNEDQS